MRTQHRITTDATSRVTITLAAALACLAPPAATGQHTTLGHDPARTSNTRGTLDTGPSDLTTPLWVFPDSDPSVAGPIEWARDAGTAVSDGLVLAVSKQDAAGNPARLWAITRGSGQLAWSAELPDLVQDSWATPTIDRRNNTVLYAGGRAGAPGGVVQARRLSDGTLLWQTQLDKDVVNASVAVTTDLGPRDRAFITDFEGFFAGGDGGVLYCINVDPFNDGRGQDGRPVNNPYAPGEIVWSVPLMSGASGATPAYADKRVYVATAGDFDNAIGGSILAFDATAATAQDAELWRTDVGGDDGFFGGLAVADGAVYAATFDFFGGRNASRIVKADANDGSILWTAPADRTNAIPVPFGDDRVLLATGLGGFGTVPSVQIFRDDANAASLVADAAVDTWQDNGNGFIEPGEFDVLGGWTQHPHIVNDHPATGGPAAFVGSLDIASAGQLFPGYDRISLIDLTMPFDDPASIVTSFDGAGSSPAVVQRSLYTVGAAGVHAFGEPFLIDVNDDGRADIEDLYAWHAGAPDRDVNRDGVVDQTDADALEAELRRHEREDMIGGRR